MPSGERSTKYSSAVPQILSQSEQFVHMEDIFHQDWQQTKSRPVTRA